MEGAILAAAAYIYVHAQQYNGATRFVSSGDDDALLM
jgi:hypothetical protein